MPLPTPAWEDLPFSIRKEATMQAVRGDPSRAISAWLLKNGYKLGHNAIARYIRLHIKPSIQKGAKAQEINALPETPQAVAHQAALDTVKRLAQDPIYEAFTKQRERLDKAIDHTLKRGEIAEYARLESVNGHTIERIARTIQHPGWQQQAATQNTVNMLVVVPGTELAGSLEQAEVVDVASNPATERDT